MRAVATIEDKDHAQRFGDYLVAQEIPNEVQQAAQGWVVWVIDEDDIERARQEFEAFQADPDAERYRDVAAVATKLRRDAERDRERRAKNIITPRHTWASARGILGRAANTGIVTGVLILISIVVALATALGNSHNALLDALLIAPVRLTPLTVEWDGLDAVRSGQLWRLVTPIFIHFGFIHILFNMWWLRDLGSHIEEHKGRLVMIVLVLVSAGVSNLAQYFWSGPYGGGMSGVIYALFGYVWMKARLEPWEGLTVSQSTVYVLIGWLFLCMTGVMGPIGNAAHVAGLVVGVVLGAAGHFLRKLRRARNDA